MPIYYTEEELYTILSPRKGQRDVHIPNEIFSDLPDNIDVYDEGKSSKHIAFAFAYHYLITYIYRYARFGSDFEFTEDVLKKICTVSPHSKGKGSVNYITKRNGLLEKIGYIEKVSDFPIFQYYDAYALDNFDRIIFDMCSEYKDDIPYLKNARNRKVNEPLKLTNTRIYKTNTGEYETNGTLYEVDFTTKISVDVYIYCMSRDDLGCEGFYLYCYLKYQNDMFKSGWNCPLNDIPTLVGMKRDIVKDRLKALEEYNMIDNSHEPFVPYLRDYTSNHIPANKYKTKSYKGFVKHGNPKRKLKKRRVISFETYEREYPFNNINIEAEMDFLQIKQ